MKFLTNKSAKDGNIWFWFIGAVVLYLLVPGFKSSVDGLLASVGGKTSTSGTSGGASAGTTGTAASDIQYVETPCTQATTLTASVVRRYTDVAQTAENVTIIQNGVLRGTIAHGSTTTVQSGINGDTLDLYPAFQSTTFYARHLNGKLSTCKGSATTGDPVFVEVDDPSPGGKKVKYTDFPNKVVQIDTNGNSNWFSIVNDGQANQNTGGTGQSTGANLTIGSGGSGSVTITFRPAYNTGLGPNGNILTCQYPQAVYDSAAPIIIKYNGEQLEETNTKPSTTNYPLTQSNFTTRAFKFPGIDGRLSTVNIINVLLRADSNHDPAGALSRVNCTVFDTNYYQRQSDGAYVLDIENRDTNVNLGATTDPSFEIGVA